MTVYRRARTCRIQPNPDKINPTPSSDPNTNTATCKPESDVEEAEDVATEEEVKGISIVAATVVAVVVVFVLVFVVEFI